MQMKDIEVGKRYATVWLHKPGDSRFANIAGLKATEFEELMRRVQCVEVLEKGVKVWMKERPGVLVQWIDTNTGEPRISEKHANKGELDQEGISTARIIVAWDEFIAAYEDRVELEEEQRLARQQRLNQERAAEHERRAKEWMERTFAEARGELERSIKVLVQVGALAGEWLVDDEMVKAQHELMYPDGNPYLNGTYEA